MKTEHNDLNYQENFASGTAIRHSLYTNNSNFSKLKQVVPDETYFSFARNSPNTRFTSFRLSVYQFNQ